MELVFCIIDVIASSDVTLERSMREHRVELDGVVDKVAETSQPRASMREARTRRVGPCRATGSKGASVYYNGAP